MFTSRAALSFVIACLALALRWPNLLLIPRFTDETAEVGWALRIARGEILPLTHVDTYNGIIFPYLMAGLFGLFGPSPLLPRLSMAILGAALAGLVAWLAGQMAEERLKTRRLETRRLETRRLETQDLGHRLVSFAGLQSPVSDHQSSIFNHQSSVSSLQSLIMAGLLTGTSFPLIVLNSHVAWSNNLTPLFTTLAMGATWWSMNRQRPGWLVAAGALWGLALQTHPSVVALLPGVLVWILWQPIGRAWLRTRWPWLACVGFGLAYGNMLVFNLTQAGASVTEASNTRNAFGLAASPSVYVENVGALLGQWARMLAGAYAPFDGQSAPTIISPLTPAYGLLGFLALAWCFRRYSILPTLALSFALILPLVSRAFDALYDTRYIAPLLPLTYLALGLAAAQAGWQRQPSRAAQAGFTTQPSDYKSDGSGKFPRAAQAGFTIQPSDYKSDGSGKSPFRVWLAFILIIAPLFAVRSFYADAEARGLTNAPLLAMAAAAKNEAAQGHVILLDRELRSLKLGGGGDPARALEYLLTLDGTDHLIARPDTINWYLVNSEAPLWLVLSDPTATSLVSRYLLTPTDLKADGMSVYTAPRAR